jgi:fructokinase
MNDTWGGIEAGGTKFVCAVGAGPDDLRAEVKIPTTAPGETLARAIGFFKEHAGLVAVGIATFGPVDLDPDSSTYGFIKGTPKPGWSNTDIAGTVGRALEVPVALDTDVNGAALGENRRGAARGLDTFIYLTIGTGIGGGGMSGGKMLHGMIHPEMGHIRIPHDRERDPFPGVCPYHGDCLEGLATGPALEARWGRHSDTLPPEHPAWDLEARYLALALVNFICTLSPQRIVMGGGVMEQRRLFPLVRRKVQELLNGYLRAPEVLDDIEGYIVPPGLGNRSGVLGAIALTQSIASPRQGT